MITVLSMKKITKTWSRPQKLQDLDEAVTRAFARFGQIHPEWAAALFDQHFLKQQVTPLLIRYAEGAEASQLDPVELATAWADQFTWFHEDKRQSLIVDLIPAAYSFLRQLEAELVSTVTWL